LLLLGGCLANPTPHAIQPTPQADAMQRMLANVLEIRSYVYGRGTRDEAIRSATELLDQSQRIAALFPPGQTSTEYVDMSPSRVRGASEAMQRTAQMLLTIVRSGNPAAIGNQLEITEREGCGSCHLGWSR
jgi:hypothetical protein